MSLPKLPQRGKDSPSTFYQDQFIIARVVELYASGPTERNFLFWIHLAEELDMSVDKCKRRWRQIRSDYARWLNSDAQRRRSGQRRLGFPYAEELKFLIPHLNINEDVIETEEDRSDDEEDNNSDQEMPLKEVAKKINKAVENKWLAKKQREEEEEKNNNKGEDPEEVEDKAHRKANSEADLASEDEQLLENTPPLVSKSPSPQTAEFFIKQRDGDSLLIISKKQSPLTDPLEDIMDAVEESADETAASGSGGRRPRRTQRATGSAGIKELPIKKDASEQRLTRLQRRKSLSMAAIKSVRSSTSPVKMTPVPRTPVTKTQTSSETFVAPRKVGPKTASKNSSDDIFPRPSTFGGPQKKTYNNNPATTSENNNNSLVFPRSSAVNVEQVNSPAATTTTRGIPQSIGQTIIKVANNNSISISTASPPPISTAQTPRLPPSSSVVISSTAANSMTISNFTPPPPTATLTQNIPSVSSAVTGSIPASYITLIKRCERGTQTQCLDIFSDDHFLDMIRPQMLEMNSRQKMHFKKKVFQALMETFDDATDFPGSGEVQHFNINTPSGFEHVSDPEMRLVRELVSLVSAAKHTTDLTTPRAPVVADSVRAAAKPSPGPVRTVVQRVYKQATAEAAPGKEKKMYRILQMSGKPESPGTTPPQSINQRKNSEDSNSSVGTRAVVSPSAPPGSPRTRAAQQDSSLNALFGAPAAMIALAAKPANPTAATAVPPQMVKVRQMSRRYSVCGVGGPPIVALGQPLAAPIPNQGNNLDAAQLKRRLMAQSMAMVPPQQRPRYTPGTAAAAAAAAAAPLNSVLVRKSAGSITSNQKQPSPTGGSAAPQRLPQITSVQGSVFHGFVQPNAVKQLSNDTNSSSSSSSPTPGQQRSHSPLKRNLVVANTKGNVQQQRVVVQKPPQIVAAGSVANLLSDPARQQKTQKQLNAETAATIAADDFSLLSSVKREPAYSMEDHDDILGM